MSSMHKKKWMVAIHASDFGGAENELIQLVILMRKLSCEVEICTRYRLDQHAAIRKYAEQSGVRLFSPIEHFWRSIKGQIVFLLSYVKYMLQYRKLPSYREQSRFGEHHSKPYRDHYWKQKEQEQYLKSCEGVIFFGEPIKWFADLYRACNNNGTNCYYRPSREIKATDVHHQPYSYFLKHLNELSGFLVLGEIGVKRVQDIYGKHRAWSLILPPYQLQEVRKIEKKDSLIRLGIVSRLVEGKRIEDGIRALSQSGRKDIQLEIAGDGALLSDLQQLTIDLKLESQVHFQGYLDNEAMPNFYSGLNGMLVCSESEGAPICGVEAAYLELPLISTPVGVLPELYGEDYPWFYPIGNIDALAELLAKLSFKQLPEGVVKARQNVSHEKAARTLKNIGINEA